MTREQLIAANTMATRIGQYTHMCEMLKNLNGAGKAALQELEGPYGDDYTSIGQPVPVDEAMRQALYGTAYNLLVSAKNDFAQLLNPPMPA